MDTLRKQNPPARSGTGRGTLLAGGVAAILASACCLGPLVLLTLGVSGAWIGNLRALESYRPLFIALALGALYLSHRRIFRSPAECQPGEICAVPAVNRTYKVLFWIVCVLLGIALAFPLAAPLFY
ncbi:MAG: mercuric ion transporter MerT [Gemmatimonadaceae bacterium]|nr:mercuric ion transporter MerT [Gemmatimonadaceae bacterium]